MSREVEPKAEEPKKEEKAENQLVLKPVAKEEEDDLLDIVEYTHYMHLLGC